MKTKEFRLRLLQAFEDLPVFGVQPFQEIGPYPRVNPPTNFSP